MTTTNSAQHPDSSSSRRYVLASRPQGWPDESTFRLEETRLPDLADGEVRVANEFLSVDPYMRGRMVEADSYVPPFVVDEPLTGGAVGSVIASRAPDLPVGTRVLHQQGWRDLAQGRAEEFSSVRDDVPASLSLHLLGMTGLTAYTGLVAAAGLREGDTVFVSGAAGAVGTAAGQFARLLGAKRVIGSAGSDQKVALLREEYGYDAAVNYRERPIREQLPEVAPEGIDVYFDNVGGDHLEAALDVMNRGGRAALCGAISGYNAQRPAPGPDNLTRLITFSLTLHGFTVGDYAREYRAEFADRAGAWLAAGDLVYDETFRDGLEATPAAFLEMMRGGNIGKMLVRLTH